MGRWADSRIVHYFAGYKDVFALMDGWLYTCWVLSITLYRSDFSSIFSHAMHRPRCSWYRSISEQQQPPAFVRGDPQWLGGVEALSAHKLPSAATVWWCRACVAVSNPKNHKDHYVFIWCLGYETGSDLDQFTSPQMIALQGLETLLLLKRRAPLLCQVRTCEVKGETFLESFRMLMDWDLGEGKSRLTTSRKTWQFAASNSVARATPPGSRRSPGGIVEAYGSWGDNKSCSVMMIRTSLDSKNVRVD